MGSPRRIYLLDQSWRLLRLFSLAGVFPIKKVETGDKVTFVPMHVCNMLAKWIFISIVTFAMAYAGIMYAASKMENMTPLALFEGLFSSTNLTSTDTLTSYTSLIVYYMANVLIIWRNFVVRNISLLKGDSILSTLMQFQFTRDMDDYLKVFDPALYVLEGSHYKRKNMRDIFGWSIL